MLRVPSILALLLLAALTLDHSAPWRPLSKPKLLLPRPNPRPSGGSVAIRPAITWGGGSLT